MTGAPKFLVVDGYTKKARDELAAGGGCHPAHPRDDGLRQADNRHHQFAALIEQAGMLIAFGDAAHFLKIVAGTKNRAFCRKNDASDIGFIGDLFKRFLKGSHHRT